MKIISLMLCFFTLVLHAAEVDEIDDYSLEESDLLADDLQEELVEEEEIDDEQLAQEKWGDLEEIIAEEGDEFSDEAPLHSRRLSRVEIDEEDAPSLPVEVDGALAKDEPLVARSSPLDPIKEKLQGATSSIQVNFNEVFRGSPTIYLLLIVLSIFSVGIWLYSMMTVRSMELLPPAVIKDLRTKLIHNQFNEALDLCVRENHFFYKMLASGILMRKHGVNMMVDAMKAEGKRSTIAFWQRIGLLNDIAIIAPMLGLLGTVLGMFYAFYDLNRSIESVSLLFDGLGISVGTTVAGLIVAIIAMILHSVAKYRLVRIMTGVESEVQNFAALIETHAPNYLESLQ